MRRSLPFVLVLVLAAAVTAIAPAPRTPTAVAQSQQAPGLSVVRAVYDILMDQFYRPLEQDALLQAAWDGIGQAAVRAGLPQPAPLGPLPAGRNDAFAAFGDAYAAYLSDAGAGVDAVSIAFVAAAAMARSPMEGHTGFLPPDSYRSFLASLG